jgi:hypothetical protein
MRAKELMLSGNGRPGYAERLLHYIGILLLCA